MNGKKEPRFHGKTTPERSRNMSRIKGKNTSIEVALRKELWKRGYRYRKNYKALPGRPDIALTKYKVAVFCDSEFFHGKDWEVLKPKLMKGSNPDYWISKIETNMERDDRNDKALLNLGWTVIHFWGKEILSDTGACVKAIEDAIFDRKIEDGEDGDSAF